MENNKKTLRLLYRGSIILGGSVAGIWAFTANRFLISECMFVILGGMIAGIGIGLICHAVTTLLKK